MACKNEHCVNPDCACDPCKCKAGDCCIDHTEDGYIENDKVLASNLGTD